MEDGILSRTHDPKLDKARVRFIKDVDAISADENNSMPRIKIPKGTIGILTGGETKRIFGGTMYFYFTVKVGLCREGSKSIHLISVLSDSLHFSLVDIN